MRDSSGKWLGQGIGDHGPTVTKIQHRLIRNYRAYSQNVHETGVYDQATADAVSEFQRRTGLPATGISDWATEVRLGVVAPIPAAPHCTIYTVPGTWAGWNDGPPAWVAWGVDHNRFRQQGVDYPAEGFLMPDPMVSYNASRDMGTAELLRLALPDRGPKVFDGYSQGADVVVRALLQWPADRRDEIKAVVTFGSPGRPPGATLLGNDPGGAGISGVYTPEWARGREYSFTLPGDMYANASGLLPQIYDILTHLDMNVDFIMYLFQILTSTFGGQLLGTIPVVGNVLGAGALSGLLGLVTPGPVTQTTGPPNLMAMMLNIPGIISALMQALQFLMTNAHQNYNVTPAFGGLTGVKKAIQIINALSV